MFDEQTIPRLKHAFQSTPTPTISALLITRNNADVIEPCLKSVVGWVDEIVVIDMMSIDGTREIIQKYHGKIIDHEQPDYAESIRNELFSLATCQWTIFLDPDERVSEKLARHLLIIAENNSVDIVKIPFRQGIIGTITQLNDMLCKSHYRFFRSGIIVQPIYEHTSSTIAHLRIENLSNLSQEYFIFQDSWRTIPQTVEKIMSSVPYEVSHLQNRGVTFSTAGLLHMTIEEFLFRFFTEEAYKNGLVGLLASFYFAFHKISIMAELWESEGRSHKFDQYIRRWGKRWGYLGKKVRNYHNRRYRPIIHRTF